MLLMSERTTISPQILSIRWLSPHSSLVFTLSSLYALSSFSYHPISLMAHGPDAGLSQPGWLDWGELALQAARNHR
ncbi:hypothetical protein BDW72DRAFT_179124 [Aspergillus terricola var. indicus]